MGKMLNAVVEKYSSSMDIPDVSQGDLFAAQKRLEQAIIDEVCHERAHEISEKAARSTEERDFFRIIEELKTIVVQCVLLALAVGILGTHIFEVVYSYVYLTDGVLDGVRIAIGFVVVALVCLALLGWISYSKLAEFVKTIKDYKSQGTNNGR